MWSSPDVVGLFSNNVVSFSRNVVLSDPLFSLNSVSKPRMLSVRADYVLSSPHVPDARGDKHIASPEAFPKTIQEAKRVRLEIDFAVAHYVAAPSSINDIQRRLSGRFLLISIVRFQIVDLQSGALPLDWP